MLVLIVGSDLRRDARQEMLMADVEFGLMFVAALDAIHASFLDGHEWSSRVLHDDSTLCLGNHGGEWTLILNPPRTTQKLCLPDETPKAKKQRLPDEMVAVSEETEAPGKSVEMRLDATGGQAGGQALRGRREVHGVTDARCAMKKISSRHVTCSQHMYETTNF